MELRWELGSEFDWSDNLLMSSASTNLFPEKYQLFSTGTAVLLSLVNFLSERATRRLKVHFPSFYCMDVVAKLAHAVDVCWYRDLPTDTSPDFSSLNVQEGDLVLAVNLFGVRDGKAWQGWFAQHPEVILVEDHSHDAFSPWAKQSTANYAMSSLRKTLPIPDGGIIWSPKNLELPKASAPQSLGASKRLTSMLLKKAFLSGIDVSKEVYRNLDIESQEIFDEDKISAVSDFTANILHYLNIPKFRQQREANIRYFANWSLTQENSDWRNLIKSWSPGAVPLNIILLCQNQIIRDALRKHLISYNIYPPIHWVQPGKGISSNDLIAVNLSSRILTIPADQRYSINDISRVATIIGDFFDNLNSQNLSKTQHHENPHSASIR